MTLSAAEVIGVLALLVNCGAIIWGAAKISAAVSALQKTVEELKTLVRDIQEIVHNLVGRVWVIEDRLDIPHRRITDVPKRAGQEQ